MTYDLFLGEVPTKHKKPVYAHGYAPIFTTRLVKETRYRYPHAAAVTIRQPEDAATLLRPYFDNKDREECVILLLNAANNVIGLSIISIGGLTASIVEPRQVFKVAVLANAAAIILAHNHPSGNLTPSEADIEITKQLVKAGKIMGIPIRDHIIVSYRGFVSMGENFLLE